MLTLSRGVLAVALVATAAIGLPTSANADGMPGGYTLAPFSWTGFYIGANAGAAWGDSELGTSVPCGNAGFGAPPCPAGSGYFFPPNIALINATSHGTASDTSFIGGIQVGYNTQAGGLVYGLEVDADWMRLTMSRLRHLLYVAGAPAGSGLDIRDEASADYLVTLRPRVGVTYGSALIYATGGLAITTLNQSHSIKEFKFNNLFSGPTDSSDLKAGWTAGGGIEWALNRKWSIKGEYLFTQFPNTTTESTFVNGGNLSKAQLFIHDADLTVQTVRAGINYKLN
jgi:outer membrane immunogenic protein